MLFSSAERPFLLTLVVIALVLIPELRVVVARHVRRRHVIVRAAALWSSLWAAQCDWEGERRPRPPSLVALGVPQAGPTTRPPQRFRRPLRHLVRGQPAHELRRVAHKLLKDVADRRERERFGVLKSA